MRNWLGVLLVLSVLLVWPLSARADGSMTVTFDTTSATGNYYPRNIVAVWIQSSSGSYVKTLARWAQTRRRYLLDWNSASGGDTVDAVTGATFYSHGTRTATWNLTDRSGSVVPDGTYTIRLELADADVFSDSQNNEGTFTFQKGSSPVNQNTSGGGFNNVHIVYTPPTTSAPRCGDGHVDPGEICDGSCPTSCPRSTDPCSTNVLMGSASTCDARCVSQPVSCDGGASPPPPADAGSSPPPPADAGSHSPPPPADAGSIGPPPPAGTDGGGPPSGSRPTFSDRPYPPGAVGAGCSAAGGAPAPGAAFSLLLVLVALGFAVRRCRPAV